VRKARDVTRTLASLEQPVGERISAERARRLKEQAPRRLGETAELEELRAAA
jgi:hypothetical protein